MLRSGLKRIQEEQYKMEEGDEGRRQRREREEEKGKKIVVGQSLLSLCNLADYDQFPWY